MEYLLWTLLSGILSISTRWVDRKAVVLLGVGRGKRVYSHGRLIERLETDICPLPPLGVINTAVR